MTGARVGGAARALPARLQLRRGAQSARSVCESVNTKSPTAAGGRVLLTRTPGVRVACVSRYVGSFQPCVRHSCSVQSNLECWFLVLVVGYGPLRLRIGPTQPQHA